MSDNEKEDSGDGISQYLGELRGGGVHQLIGWLMETVINTPSKPVAKTVREFRAWQEIHEEKNSAREVRS